MINFDHFIGAVPKRNLVSHNGDSDSFKPGKFVNFLIRDSFKYEYNYSVLTEEEKQRIYLKFHDEMPWDYSVTCASSSSPDVPEDTESCGKTFYLSEKDIFKKDDNYFMLCPNCGYMVSIPSEELTKGTKDRIDERCALDEDLFRRMSLYSELVQLENKAPKDAKRLVKVNNARRN